MEQSDKIKFTKEEINKILQDPGWIKKDMTFTSELKTIQYLVQNHPNFDINLWGINGHTDLHTFVLNDKIEIVKYLLEIKGDPLIYNIYGNENALMASKKSSCKKIFNLLKNYMI